MLYSEGPYEDINKTVCSYILNTKDFKYKDILREYISYEYSHELVEDITELIMCLEKIHRDYGYEGNKIYDKRLTHLVKELSEEINNNPSLRNNWKWRMLYIRAQTEESRLAYLAEHNINSDFFPEIVKIPEETFTERELDLLRELRDIYEFTGKYTGTDTDTHAWLAPLVK
ncbi:MAG: hypothetical protein KBT47_01330 [Armatimonadetes bacterium]|nr:hypothetical protein [Candidatus Hippobium faecium]